MVNNDPLHGITLEDILYVLEDHFGWNGLSQRIDIRCFKQDPSIKSSLKFLRKTPWARSKVEQLYIDMVTRGEAPEKTEPKAGKKSKNRTRANDTTRSQSKSQTKHPVETKKEPKVISQPEIKPIDPSKFKF